MKTFDSIRHYFEVLGFSSSQSTRKDLLKIQNVIYFLILLLYLTLTSVFAYYEADSFEKYIDSFYAISSALVCIDIFGICFWETPKLYRFINSLERTIKERLVHPRSKRIYIRPDHLIVKWNGILHLVFVKVTPVCVMVPKFITSFLIYFSTDLGKEAFELAIPGQWFPFDWKNPIGYTVATVIQYTINLDMFIGMVFLVVFQMGSVAMLILMTKDLKCDLRSINRRLKLKENRAKIAKHFKKLIKFHSDTKQLIKDFAGPLEPIFAAVFVWSVTNICASMIMIRTELDTSGITMTVFYRFYQMFFSFVAIFLICEFGHRVSSAFEETNDAIGRLYWYLFPIETWKLLPIVIAGAHHPVEFTAFGGLSCSRIDFKLTVNSGYSYYMLLGQIELR